MKIETGKMREIENDPLIPQRPSDRPARWSSYGDVGSPGLRPPKGVQDVSHLSLTVAWSSAESGIVTTPIAGIARPLGVVTRDGDRQTFSPSTPLGHLLLTDVQGFLVKKQSTEVKSSVVEKFQATWPTENYVPKPIQLTCAYCGKTLVYQERAGEPLTLKYVAFCPKGLKDPDPAHKAWFHAARRPGGED